MPQDINNIVQDTDLFSFISFSNWYLQIVFIIITTFIVNYIVNRSLKRLELHVQSTDNVWDDAILHSAYLPIRLIGWLIGLTLILGILNQQGMNTISSWFFQFRKIAFIVVLALFVYRLIYHIHQSVIVPNQADPRLQNTKLDSASIEAISKLLRLSVVIVAILTILQVLGYSISGILAFGGMGGIAVGFAAKDLLANFFGGLMIYLDKPFKVGEWVRSPDRNIEGTVEHIGWRISRIRTFDKRPLYIPNSLFANIIVENPSRMSHRRIKEHIGIRYDDWKKMEIIVTDIKTMLIHHQGIDSTETLICNFDIFNESSIDFLVYTFTKTTDLITFHEVKQDVLFKIFEIIDSHGAEIAFPTRALLINKED